MPLTEYYRTEGSGSLQFKAANSKYKIDTLARMMITESDNSATNMIMAELGSMTDINSGIREWGAKAYIYSNLASGPWRHKSFNSTRYGPNTL